MAHQPISRARTGVWWGMGGFIWGLCLCHARMEEREEEGFSKLENGRDCRM